MPWTASDAQSHTKKAKTPYLKRLWANVANSALKQYDNEALAVASANGAVAKAKKKGNRRS